MHFHPPLLMCTAIMESFNEDQDREIERPCTPENVYSALVNAKLNCSVRVFGSQLGLDPSDLDLIEQPPHDQPPPLMKVLIKCSQRAECGLTWTWIADVLRKPALREFRVASCIEQQYVRRHSSVSSSILSPLSSSTSSTDYAWPPPVDMEIEEEFSIPVAVNMIQVILDWQELGRVLGLLAIDINEISGYNKKEHRQRLIETWYARDGEFSREKLQRAMTEVSSRRGSYDSVSSVPSTPTSPPGDVKSQIKELNKRFGKLQTSARRELEIKHNSIGLVEDELYSLPCNIQQENHKLVMKLATNNRIERFTNLKVFFLHLHAHCWNFLEYRVLEILIENHCSDELKEKMKSYVRDIQAFKDQTKVSEFIDCAADLALLQKATSVLKTFNKFTVEHEINPDTHTLSELDEFRTQTRSAVCRRYKLFECAIQVYGVRRKCIIVEWMVPEELTYALRDFYYSKEGQELQQIHHIQMVLIDGKSVPTSILLAAVSDEDREKIKAVLQDTDADIDLNSSDEETHQTALLYTAKCGDMEIVEILTERGADIHLIDKLQRTALMHASHEGHINIVGLLLKKGAEPNRQASGGWTALMLASYRGHVETVEMLLEYSSDVNLTTEQGWTALQRVCLYNLTRYPKAKYKPSERRAEIAKLLIDHETNIQKIDRQGRTPLIAASDSGFADIVKLLVDKISELPDEERQKYLDYKKHFSWTALMSASEKGHAEVVRILIEAGASRSLTKEKDEVSALHIAVQNGHVEVVEALTHKMDKDDLNARDNYGMTPLILATKKKSEQLMNVLIHAGADVDAQSKDGDQMTALMFAVKVGSFDVVKLLVERSANLFAENSRKETVLEMAKNSSKEIRDYLSEKCKQAEEEQQSQRTTALL